MADFMDYINPALLALVPALYIIGGFIRKVRVLDNRFIPAILGLIGIVLAVLFTLSTSEIATWQNALSAVFTAVIQGVLCAGASVYANQIKKQAGENKK
ncbi:MAG: phage holin family protein [Oscillospiraceae bacterium]|jgi:hypothetical protein|nr:phage holin family protein [Oscillospiraceae bacterium]